MKSNNRRGPRLLPWGTPERTGSMEELEPGELQRGQAVWKSWNR